MTNRRLLYWLVLLALLLAAFALRLFRLDAQSLWWDEGISLHLATSTLGELVRDRLNNIHPPLYFILLKGWLALVGVSPFTGRYLSTLAALIQVALVYALARQWGGPRRTAWPWLAAGLLLIAPLSIIYGQEIRVYAFLPAVYLVMLLAAGAFLAFSRRTLRPLVVLAMAEWIGLHLHYVALFAVAFVALWGLVVLWRRGDRAGLRRWLASQTLVALLSLPWLIALLLNLAAVRAEANAGAFTADPVPLPFLFAQVWTFHLTGLAGALSSRFAQIGAAVAAVLLAGLLLARLPVTRRHVSDRALTFRLLASWTLPLLSGLAVWSVRSFSHPRYIVMFALLLVPLATFLMVAARRRAEQVAGAMLGVVLVALSLWGLDRYFFDPAAAKPDVRGAAHYLEQVAALDDLSLIPDTDWSLPFEYKGPASVSMPGLDKPTGSNLDNLLDCTAGPPCAASGRVFVLDYPGGTRDWQGRLPFELARRGTQVGETAFDDVSVAEYRLTRQPGALPGCDAPDLRQPAAHFGPLHLSAAWVDERAPSDSAVDVALCWDTLTPAAAPLTVSLVLRDPLTGERIAQTDAELLDAAGAPTTQWPAGASVRTYHLLPLPPGTPPIEADLSLGVYAAGSAGSKMIEATGDDGRPLGSLASLGDVALQPPTGPWPTATELAAGGAPVWAAPVAAADGLQLEGAFFAPGPYRPGQTIRVSLTWRATAGELPDYRPALTLSQGETVPAENSAAMVNGRYPTDRWQAGEAVREVRDVRAPAGSEGTAQLTMRLGKTIIPLGEVTIEGQDLLFTRPEVGAEVAAQFGDAIALIGFDPPAPTVSPAEEIPVTLYWESLAGDHTTGYTVFAHLLAADGRLLAQHDSPPANGLRATDEWLPGEFIVDPHRLIWRDMSYSGPARLVVGLYDPATGERLRTADGADSLTLPVQLTVVPPQ